MIVFNLRCGGDHVFEAWFKDGATYDRQSAAGDFSRPPVQVPSLSIRPAAWRMVLKSSISP